MSITIPSHALCTTVITCILPSVPRYQLTRDCRTTVLYCILHESSMASSKYVRILYSVQCTIFSLPEALTDREAAVCFTHLARHSSDCIVIRYSILILQIPFIDSKKNIVIVQTNPVLCEKYKNVVVQAYSELCKKCNKNVAFSSRTIKSRLIICRPSKESIHYEQEAFNDSTLIDSNWKILIIIICIRLLQYSKKGYIIEEK